MIDSNVECDRALVASIELYKKVFPPLKTQNQELVQH
jgi:hypothetical protein